MSVTAGKYHRVQLDFSEEAFEELETLKKRLSASSRAEVVRAALGVLKWAVNHSEEGNKIQVARKADNKVVGVEFPFLFVS
ncbi:MAG: hypothetical protein G01um101448_679 [Parcubacteria group bacterium Gr01-1014_48]|nr:MAG: hypothetical protein Greene041614_776 [Parcubacteria group bacterium Greene0416_14]TSC73628.1 MAG: hypothetical protein G01um101448_679 [Parcubacteria group bacterium Gr01-1014_48]TSD00906.1 MAG: hypothetical protein Greene101415_620 [Parcubacteria group bacterium Greene1014_15]TSD07988.1 MAG: hypothetical protein Greene07144_529 [Parcubacteria group bacterium Greene0714_4]